MKDLFKENPVGWVGFGVSIIALIVAISYAR
jgi:hypothetical protein